MTKEEVQELLFLRRDLSHEEQIWTLTAILDDFVSRCDPCELYFAAFSIEHFLSGYITPDLEKNLSNVYLSEFLDNIPDWLRRCAGQNAQKEGQVLYYICRFLVAKNQMSQVRELCSEFLERDDREGQLDTITYSYIRHFSQKNEDVQVQAHPGKLLQADVYIRYSTEEARKQISRHFLDDPYESVLYEYPAHIRGTFARLYYMQSLVEKQDVAPSSD